MTFPPYLEVRLCFFPFLPSSRTGLVLPDSGPLSEAFRINRSTEGDWFLRWNGVGGGVGGVGGVE